MKSWPESEKPRERLIRKGIDVLSDAELIAILLRNGLKGKDVLELSRELLQRFGGLRGLLSASWQELNEVRGLGPAKITSLIASREISLRLLREQMVGKNVVRDPQSVLNYLTLSLRDRKTEIFKVLFLNKANSIMSEEDLFSGTVDETAVHPREVVKAALEHHATGLILVHNHPSGRIEPSPADRAMTVKLQSACATVSIQILDHIIVGDNQYFSFKEKGLI